MAINFAFIRAPDAEIFIKMGILPPSFNNTMETRDL